MPLSVALVRERRDGERRVALVPASVARLLEHPGLGVRIERDCGRAAGFRDEAYAGVTVAADFAATVEGADIVAKVGVPTLEEIAQLAPGTVLVTLTRAFGHREEIGALIEGGITTIGMDLMPRSARARSMDAIASQATVAGYKAALLAAELSPRLFPMMTTAAGTIRPSRVVVIGAGVAGLQVIATARRLGAEVEAYDIRRLARERIESLGARMIDTGVEATDAAGLARALRRDEQRRQHEVLAERLSRAHAVVCAASIPNRAAPRIVTTDMVEGMLPDTVIVDMAAATGGNCELTRPGKQVQHGDTLIVGPLNLPSHGAVHASEMYSRNVTNLLALIIDADGELDLGGDDIVARAMLTHAGGICHAPSAALLERACRPFGDRGDTVLDEEGPDVEADWADEASAAASARGGAHEGARGRGGTALASDDAAALADPGSGEKAGEVDSDGKGDGAGDPSLPGGATRAATGPDATDGAERGETERTAPAAPSTSSGSPDAASERAVEPSAGGTSAPTAGARGGEAGKGADAPPAELPAEDLTVIDGIGPALQGRLHAFGVTRLETLAELDEAGRQRLAVQLELDDEIEREDWSGQARALIEARRGEGEGH